MILWQDLFRTIATTPFLTMILAIPTTTTPSTTTTTGMITILMGMTVMVVFALRIISMLMIMMMMMVVTTVMTMGLRFFDFLAQFEYGGGFCRTHLYRLFHLPSQEIDRGQL